LFNIKERSGWTKTRDENACLPRVSQGPNLLMKEHVLIVTV